MFLLVCNLALVIAAAVCGAQVKLSIVQLVGSGGLPAERAACLLIVAAADSRHR